MRPITTLALIILCAAPLDAQVVRLPQRASQPLGWLSLSVGLHSSGTVVDGGTGTTWDFGSGLVYRASIEQAMPNQGALGLTGTYARMPLRHTGDASCPDGCDAHGNIWQALASFQIGGGQGFHQVIQFTAGVTHYSNFTDDESGEPLAPLDGDNDFTIGVGYGFGYGFSSRTQLVLIQDFVTTLHQRHGLSGNTSNFVNQRTTRVGLRFGMGSRSRFRGAGTGWR